jgi:hypothetical protein
VNSFTSLMLELIAPSYFISQHVLKKHVSVRRNAKYMNGLVLTSGFSFLMPSLMVLKILVDAAL